MSFSISLYTWKEVQNSVDDVPEDCVVKIASYAAVNSNNAQTTHTLRN